MDANFAAQSQRLVLAENAYLELLPGPTIPHRHSRFITHTQATVADGATLLSPGADIAGECIAGASRLPNDAGLVYKVFGMETEPVKSKVRAFWDPRAASGGRRADTGGTTMGTTAAVGDGWILTPYRPRLTILDP
jgi:UreD urease accessory protein